MSFDCFCDYEPASVYSARTIKARKPYRCDECANHIRIGEEHEYVFGVWDRQPGTFRTCTDCTELRQWVRNNVPCFCWAHGNLRDDATEAVREAAFRAPEETRGLRFGFLRLQKRQELNRRYTEVPFS